MEYPPLDKLASSKNPAHVACMTYAMKLDPKPHRNVFLKPFHKTRQLVPEFCSACHKVHLDVPVNNYRWIRGFNDYDNWQASGVSGQGRAVVLLSAQAQMRGLPHAAGALEGFRQHQRIRAFAPLCGGEHGRAQPLTATRNRSNKWRSFLKGALSVDIFALAEEPAETAGQARTMRGGGEAPATRQHVCRGRRILGGLGGSGGERGRSLQIDGPAGAGGGSSATRRYGAR